jgi:antitoxin component of MazEF toxin-antitoxin module
VQIPADLLSKLELGGNNKVKMEFKDGKVIISAPSETVSDTAGVQ